MAEKETQRIDRLMDDLKVRRRQAAKRDREKARRKDSGAASRWATSAPNTVMPPSWCRFTT